MSENWENIIIENKLDFNCVILAIKKFTFFQEFYDCQLIKRVDNIELQISKIKEQIKKAIFNMDIKILNISDTLKKIDEKTFNDYKKKKVKIFLKKKRKKK